MQLKNSYCNCNCNWNCICSCSFGAQVATTIWAYEKKTNAILHFNKSIGENGLSTLRLEQTHWLPPLPTSRATTKFVSTDSTFLVLSTRRCVFLNQPENLLNERSSHYRIFAPNASASLVVRRFELYIVRLLLECLSVRLFLRLFVCSSVRFMNVNDVNRMPLTLFRFESGTSTFFFCHHSLA